VRHHGSVRWRIVQARWIAIATATVLALAGCGGSSKPAPEIALLTDVRAAGDRVTFAFRSAPERVDVRRASADELVEDGSGRTVRVRGSAFLVVRFEPASGFDLSEPEGRATYEGARRLAPESGPVQEVVRLGDFEAVLTWAIGLDAHRAWHVERSGPEVTIEVD
jgi:hypothetical protein